jgi:hypothetical protein
MIFLRKKMNKRVVNIMFFLIAHLAFPFNLTSQQNWDNQWILGQNSGILFDFTSGDLDISIRDSVNFVMEASNISISDSTGNQLLFYTNGCAIKNSLDEIMENGDSINPGIVQDYYCADNGGGTGSGSGSPVLQGALALPQPDSPNIFYLFNLDLDFVTYQDTITTLDPKRLFYHMIDMTLNNGLGAVVSKNQIAIEDTIALARSHLKAVKHSNGRDWWIIVPKAESNCYYLQLLTPDGLLEPKLECEGEEWEYRHAIGQSVFTPNGIRLWTKSRLKKKAKNVA